MYRVLLTALCLVISLPVFSGKPEPLICNQTGVPDVDKRQCLETYKKTGVESLQFQGGSMWAKTDLVDDSWILRVGFQANSESLDSGSLYIVCGSIDEIRVYASTFYVGPVTNVIHRFGYDVAQSGDWVLDSTIGYIYLSRVARHSFLDRLRKYDRLVVRIEGRRSEKNYRSTILFEFNRAAKELALNVLESSCSHP